MKKHVKLFTVLLFCLLLCLTGCEKATNDGTAEEYTPPSDIGPYSITAGGMSFYFDVDDNCIYVYEDQGGVEPYQTVYHDGVSDLTLARRGFIFSDYNFDGYGDIAVPSLNNDEGQYYFVCLWNDAARDFEYSEALSGIANLRICDGYLEGERDSLTVKYYIIDGVLTDESLVDENSECALEYAKGILKKDDLSVSFVRFELVDGCFCRLYFVYEGGEMCAYIAPNNDRSRVFYSDMSDVYCEIVRDGDQFSKRGSYTGMEYSDTVFTYSSEGMASLNDSQRDYYGKIYDKIIHLEEFSYSSANAVVAMKAVLADYPEVRCYFEYEESDGVLYGKYFYPWDKEASVDKEILSEAVSEYDSFINEIIDEMPRGLEPYEKYIYLAQVEQIEPWSDMPTLDFPIPADSRGESLAATFQLLCRKAGIYCTYDSTGNTILTNGEKKRVSLDAAFEYSPGSAEWKKAFFAD